MSYAIKYQITFTTKGKKITFDFPSEKSRKQFIRALTAIDIKYTTKEL